MQKNVAGQKWIVFAFDLTDNTPKTGDAANITANLRLDGGAANAVDDTNPTELEDGYYVFDISQAESNANMIVICPSSTTSNIQVIGVPGAIWTTPPNFPALGIESDGDLTKVNDVGTGGGDYAVTLTIRTTGGTPIAGVCVWVNTSNDRSGNVVGARYTDSNGQVTFNLEYTTYYVFCRLANYTFASSSFTAAAGSTSFTKDIGSVVNNGQASAYSDSFLSRGIIEVQDAVSEPIIKAKWTDAKIIRELEKSYMLVLNEINRNSKTQITAKYQITVAANTTKYILPYTMGSVRSIYNLDETGGKVHYDSRGPFNSAGRAIWLEGKTLNLQTTEMYGQGLTLVIEYFPSGVARLHNGACTVSADGLTVTFGATPNNGVLDTHPEAYSGYVFRILGVDGTTVTGNNLQERNILQYDHTTRQATLDVALNPIPTTDDGYIYYEIAPAIHKGMDTVLSLYAAYKIALTEGNRKRSDGILAAYRNEIRNVRLTEYYTNLMEAPRMKSDSFENRRYGRNWRM
jgi:hypothetical protein